MRQPYKAPSYAERRAKYEAAVLAYHPWASTDDATLSDRDRRRKLAAHARVERSWSALKRTKKD